MSYTEVVRQIEHEKWAKVLADIAYEKKGSSERMIFCFKCGKVVDKLCAECATSLDMNAMIAENDLRRQRDIEAQLAVLERIRKGR